MDRVTVIGLGAIGTAVSEVLIRGGRPTTVWNRSHGKADNLVARGADRANTAAEAATASSLVILCLLDHRAVDDVLGSIDDDMTGRVLVNLTSGTPEQARKTAAWAAERGAEYLDGGVLADPENIGTSQTMFLYSGSRPAYESHQTTLEALGSAQYLGADAGHASLYFMALIGIGYETWVAYLDTLALGGTEGVDATTIAPHVTEMFASMTELLIGWARAADTGRHPPDAGPLGVHAALMGDLIQTRRARGIDVGQLERVEGLIDRALTEGHEAEGFSALMDLIRPLTDAPRGGA